MSVRLKSAICVIGGGPAGAATARRLAQLSHSVVVVEREVFPRAHVGESITPGVLPTLDALGIKERIERQGFLRPERVLISWPPHRGYKATGPVPGFQVQRAKFDAIMLDSAREAGALVLQGARLVSSERNIGGGWDLTISWRGTLMSAERCFIVDATGRRSLMRSKKRRYGARTLALYNYWRGCGIVGNETRVEAAAEQWYWGAPVPDGSFNATVFVDPERFRHDLHQMGSVDSVYQNLLARSELLAACLKGRPAGPAMVCDATCYADDDPVEPYLIKVGEALFSVDPLSSQGVQTALGTALHAAATINTATRRAEDRETAEQFYRGRLQEAVNFHGSAAADLYGRVAMEREAQFWQRRARKNTPDQQGSAGADSTRLNTPPPGKGRLRLATDTQILSVPCIDGNFIVKRQGVAFPNRVRPTVFLGEIAIAPLLECLRAPLTVQETLRVWSQRIQKDQVERLLHWLWTNGVIVEVG